MAGDWTDEQEEAVGVGQFIGFRARFRRPDLGIGEHRPVSKSTTIFDRTTTNQYLQFGGGLWTGTDSRGRTDRLSVSIQREKASRVDFCGPLKTRAWRSGRDSK